MNQIRHKKFRSGLIGLGLCVTIIGALVYFFQSETFNAEAMKEAKERCDLILFPYENAEGMAETENVIKSIKKGTSIAVFIGPEGGFAPEEVVIAEESGAKIISLGRRILRTETAAMAVLSHLMIQAETLE